MSWEVKPKTQRFEGLGWYLRCHGPLGVESTGTINEHGNNVVIAVNDPLTPGSRTQSKVVARSLSRKVILYLTNPTDSLV